MSGSRWLLKCIALLTAILFFGSAAAEQCTAIFPGGIQSHSPSGNIQMGYMSRVYGSGPMLTAPTVTHTHSWQDQVGLCDGVKCTASGTRASTQDVDFLTGTEVPAVFELSTSNNNVSNGYNAGALALPAADYGTVSIGQESTVRFTTVDGTYRTKSITTHYKSVIEFQPGTYWVSGNLDWTAQDTRIRRLNGSNGRVTLYVSGNVSISQLHFQGFSEGQIRIYAKGNVTAGNDFIFPGEIHAEGRVGFGERAKITGGIYSGNFSTGNGAVVRYTRQNHDHKMGALNPAYNSTFELTPGNYWIDGGFDASVASKFRKVGGSGVVRLFVRGNVNVQHGASFEGFAGGDLVMYSTGKITLTSQTDLPAFVYAVDDVEINFSQGARYRGGITGRNVYIGQNSIVQYLDPVDLGPLCDDQPSVTAVDHYELIYSSTALTCQAVPVTVSAYDSQGNLATVPVTVTLSPSGAWQGNGTLTFIGQGTAYMKRNPGDYTLGIAAADHAPINTTLCSTANCQIKLRDSGFIFKELSPIIAGKEQPARIQAVRKDETTELCIPGFTEGVPRQIYFSAKYDEPISGTMSPIVAGTPLVPGGAAKSISLTFDVDASAPLPVIYMDAGRIELTASYTGSTATGDAGLVMTGEDSFVSRPWGLCISTTSDINDDSASGPVLAKAGYEFEQKIKAVVWTSDSGGPLTAQRGPEVCSNNPTPNYTQTIGLASKVVAPSGSEDGILGRDQYEHLLNGAGETTLSNQSLSEVGIFNIIATPPDYLGADMGHAESISGLVGRIIPAYFSLEDPKVTQSCGSFTYAGLLEKSEPPSQLEKKGQPFYVSGKLYALNRDGDVTQNYKDNFSKLTPDSLDFIDSRKVGNKIIFELGDFVEAIDGNGDRYFNYERDLQFFFEIPTGPYKLAMQVIATDDEGVEGAVVDRGEDLEGNKDDDFLPEFRLGIARLSNAHGSELQNLSLDFTTAYFDGSSYVLNGQDNCSVLAYSSELDIVNLNGDLKNDTEIVNRDSPLLVVKGKEQIVLKAPAGGKTGSVEVTPTLEGAGWLKYEWDGDDELKAPTGLATFGIYKGPKPLIFRREVYRN